MFCNPGRISERLAWPDFDHELLVQRLLASREMFPVVGYESLPILNHALILGPLRSPAASAVILCILILHLFQKHLMEQSERLCTHSSTFEV
jgi:hypothetical protein